MLDESAPVRLETAPTGPDKYLSRWSGFGDPSYYWCFNLGEICSAIHIALLWSAGLGHITFL